MTANGGLAAAFDGSTNQMGVARANAHSFAVHLKSLEQANAACEAESSLLATGEVPA